MCSYAWMSEGRRRDRVAEKETSYTGEVFSSSPVCVVLYVNDYMRGMRKKSGLETKHSNTVF